MLYFKDPENRVHAQEVEGFEYLLPAGCVPITEQEAASLTAPPALTLEQQISANRVALQTEMDRRAAMEDFDSIFTAVSYAGNEDLTDPVQAKFQAQGNAFKAWRSQVWAASYAYLELVKTGEKPMPSPQEAVAMMPILSLPA